VESFFDANLKTAIGRICSACSPKRGLEPGLVYTAIPSAESTVGQASRRLKPWERIWGSSQNEDPGLVAPPFMPSYDQILGVVRQLGLQNCDFDAARDYVQNEFFGRTELRPHAIRYLDRAVEAAQCQLRTMQT
jgi:hypothetical protein